MEPIFTDEQRAEIQDALKKMETIRKLTPYSIALSILTIILVIIDILFL